MTAKSFFARTLLASIGLSLCLIAGLVFAADVDLTRARALMNEGKAAEAYALLEPQEFDTPGTSTSTTCWAWLRSTAARPMTRSLPSSVSLP
jgi:hypothetical protein